MTITVELSAAQIRAVVAANRRQARAVAAAAVRKSVPRGFVFFAAFDGTNNDMENAGSAQNTNVAQLWTQYRRAAGSGSRFGGGYFAGPGTKGTLTLSSWLPDNVLQQVTRSAEGAYGQFCLQASAWLKNPRKAARPLSAVVAAFSRGCASAALFSQLLHARGVDVAAGVLFDPVMTGVSVDLAFAPTARNIVDILAANEYRQEFRGADYRDRAGITTVPMLGNHCDIGGGYDNGIAALSLQAATAFLRASGLRIARVDPSRSFKRGEAAVHDEGKNPDGTQMWSTYASFESLSVDADTRLRDRVVRA